MASNPPDLSQYSDEELARIAAGAKSDLSAVPTADLEKIAGAQPAMAGLAATSAPAAPGPALHPTTPAESALRGALAYGSRNWGDEISAGVGAGLYGLAKGVRSFLPGGVPAGAPSVGDVYSQILDQQRTEDKSAAAAHPFIYHGAGIATSALQTPGVASAGQLPAAARIAALARSGAITGALTGAGAAEGGIGDKLAKGARGAVYGALLTPAINEGVRGLGALSGSIADASRKGAGYALSRIAGGIQRDVGPAGGAAAFANAGLEGYEQGLIRPLDVLPGAAERQAERVANFAQQSTNDIVSAIDDAGARVAVSPLKQTLINASAKLRQFPETSGDKISKIDGIIRDLEKQADSAGTVSARTLQTAKEIVDDTIKSWDPFSKSSLAQDLNRSVYSGIREAQEQAVETAGGAAGRAAYEAAKKSSALAQRLEAFQDSAARRQGNQLAAVGGLHGAGAGLAGLYQAITKGDPLGGLATYAAARTLTSPRTAAIVGLGAEKVARALPTYAQSALNPLLARSAAQAIVASLNQ